MLLGVTVTAIIIQVVFIISAVAINYYSGIDLHSTIIHVPIYIVFEMIVGGVILLSIKLIKKQIITNEYVFIVF